MICLVIALAIVGGIRVFYRKIWYNGRFVTIDGLRGYLAFNVFVHHACVWYGYIHTSAWRIPPSLFYTHLGQDSVVLFFMITGFLFLSKLTDSKDSGVNWGKIYTSRFFRLVPVYIVMVALLVLMVLCLSDFRLTEPPGIFLFNLLRWLLFTAFGAPDLNGIKDTSLIVSAVTWSLPYEWFFYFSLPLWAFITHASKSYWAVFWGGMGMLLYFLCGCNPFYLLAFAGGFAATILARYAFIRKFLSHPGFSLIFFLILLIEINFFPTVYLPGAVPLLAAAFCIVACGNTLFGILESNISRVLGEMTYSLYLLHGLLLFCVMHFLGQHFLVALSPLQYWTIIALLTPVLIVGCFISFRFIEEPCMRFGKQLGNAKIRLNPQKLDE